MTQHKPHVDDSVIISSLNHLANLARVKNHYSALIMAVSHLDAIKANICFLTC